MNQLSQLIHATLFMSGETWSFRELAETLQSDLDSIEKAVSELSVILQDQAIVTLVHNDSVTLVTRPELHDHLKTLEKEEMTKEFSKGALETLALIAYHGPITKPDIDYIRGVNSQFMIRNLVLRGMIEKSGTGGRSAGYVITADALRFLGVTQPHELPGFSEFHDQIAKRIPLDTFETNGETESNSELSPEPLPE